MIKARPLLRPIAQSRHSTVNPDETAYYLADELTDPKSGYTWLIINRKTKQRRKPTAEELQELNATP